jgi:tripartite-type tricarboxylate transporter receptor subunit TctC
MMRRREFLAGGLAALATPDLAGAQGSFPTKQVHLIVPTSSGGVHDVIGRIWAERVKGALGNIVVENRAGGGSSIALNYVVQQPATRSWSARPARWSCARVPTIRPMTR